MNDALRSIMDKYDELHKNDNEVKFDIEKDYNDYMDNHDPYDYRQIMRDLEPGQQ